VNFRFVMTMLGFSITFVVAEVIPLFLITLFTVIAFDLNASSYSIWMLNSQVIAVGAIAPFVGRLSDLLGRKNITLLSLSLTIIAMITLGTAKTITAALAAQCISGTAIVRPPSYILSCFRTKRC
jgi:MFS family permease